MDRSSSHTLMARVACLVVMVAALLAGWPGAVAAQVAAPGTVAHHARALVLGDTDAAKESLEYLRERGDPDIAAAAILALRFRPDRQAELLDLLRRVTGGDGRDWFDWMVWQERNAGIVPYAGYAALLREVMVRIDPGYLLVLGEPWLENARIRAEEITWGGVGALVGIPSLDRPAMVGAAEADYLLDDDLVFGVAIEGDARAYPLRIMGWHEMFNDVIGGVPVALAYCTLCGSGILYETTVEGRDEPLVFGSSGLLYRSNKLMFDWATKSLWNQFTGEPVVGPLADSGIVLRTRPVVVTSWRAWRERNPDTMVLSLQTGHVRDYGPGAVYREYFASTDLMFPSAVRDGAGLAPKDYVFGLRDVAAAKAWPLAAFAGGAVINDRVGAREVVLIGDAATREVRAFERDGRTFTADGAGLADAMGGAWTIGEDALVGPGGARLARLPGAVSYWFAWDSYLGVRSELYTAE